MTTNPKMEGSGIIDAIPQTGKCPNACGSCFYNEGFYRTLDEPLMPSAEEARRWIVRVNSGHDSALLTEEEFDDVVDAYSDLFFNTSLPDQFIKKHFKFGRSNYPFVVTVNPGDMTDKDFHRLEGDMLTNLMFVRVRVNLWNVEFVKKVCKYYSKLDVPIVLTYMRYKTQPDRVYGADCYQKVKHIINSYWQLSKYNQWHNANYYIDRYPRVHLCGSRFSSLCRDCGTCLREYMRIKVRLSC